jgi:diacylglycerol kinase (ATP)
LTSSERQNMDVMRNQKLGDLDYCVILNPTAGSGHALKEWPKIQAALDEQGLNYHRMMTGEPGEATRFSMGAAQKGYDVVVAVGGDGTAHEVINGLMQVRDEVDSLPALGLIGVGRGNDFAHAVGVPVEINSAVRTLVEDQRRTIDIGQVEGGFYPTGRFFGNCVGIGFDAVGTIEAAKLPRWGGFLSFFIAVIKTIFLYHRGPLIELHHNGEILKQRILMVSIMNGQRLGGGFWMAPRSAPDDGIFDICVVRQVSRRRVFTLVPHFLRGTQASQPEVLSWGASEIEIRALEGSLPAQTDGEILSVDDKHLKIALLPRALSVVTASRLNEKKPE